jgi:hypothetical protein
MGVVTENIALFSLLLYMTLTTSFEKKLKETFFSQLLLFGSVLFYIVAEWQALMSTLLLLILSLIAKNKQSLEMRIITSVKVITLCSIVYYLATQEPLMPELINIFSVLSLFVFVKILNHQVYGVLLFLLMLSNKSTSLELGALITVSILLSCLEEIKKLEDYKSVINFSYIILIFQLVEGKSSPVLMLYFLSLLLLCKNIFKDKRSILE